jgi:host factor-I protein
VSRFESRGDYPRGTGTAHRKLIRPPLNSAKESFNGQAAPVPSNPARKKPAPPDQTHAENFYFLKQMQARTPVTVVLTDGESLDGTVEWYDRDCIKLTRNGRPNLMIYKHSIKYLFKSGDEAASGGSNPSPDGIGNGKRPNKR